MFVWSEDSPADPLGPQAGPEQLDAACRVAVVQEKMVREFDLDALTYYYRGKDGNAYEQLQEAFILGHSPLTAQGIPCSGEGDMKTAVAMKVCDILGVGGSYSEIAAVDYQRGTIMLGHDGPFHLAIAGRKPILRGLGLYHGKWGSGVSVEATVRTGPVTVLNMTQDAAGRLRAIVNEGEAIDAPVLQRRQHAHARSFRPAAHALHGRLVRDGAHAPRRLERRTQRRGVPQGRRVDGLALPERRPVTVCQAQEQPLPAE